MNVNHPTAIWALTLFGGASLKRAAGAPVTLQRRPMALLALLATAGERGMSRDRLTAVLWPDSAEEQARAALRQVLHVLRRALSEANPIVGSVDLALNPALIESDVARFERLIKARELGAAVELYTDPFLNGFCVSGADEFERWAGEERARFARSYARSLTQLVSEAESAGDARAAVEWWHRLTVHDPLSSQAALGYMRALAATGNGVDALRHFRVHEALVRAEPESDVHPAFGVLVASLRERRQALAFPSAPASAPIPISIPPGDRIQQIHRLPVKSAPRRSWPLAGGGAVVAAIALGAVWYTVTDRPRNIGDDSVRPRSARSAPVRIAILPFRAAGDTTRAYVADGVADAIRWQLASVRSLEVIALTSSEAYRNSDKPLDEIASDLRVGYILTGRFAFDSTASSRPMVLQTSLVAAGRKTPVLSSEFRISMPDLAHVSDAIATRTANALGVALLQPPSIDSLPAARRADAFDDFLRAEELAQFNASSETNRYEQAIPYYRKALSEDSLLGPAWVELARAEANVYLEAPSIAHANAAHFAVRQAKTLAPAWPSTFLAEGVVAQYVDADHPQALVAFEAGLRGNPLDADLLTSAGDMEQGAGDWKAALARYQTAVSVDPRSARASSRLVHWYILQRRCAEAITEAGRSLSFAPRNLNLRREKIEAQLGLGDLAAARRTMRDAPPDVDRTAMAAYFGFDELSWALDDSLKALLVAASPAAFALDSGSECAYFGQADRAFRAKLISRSAPS